MQKARLTRIHTKALTLKSPWLVEVCQVLFDWKPGIYCTISRALSNMLAKASDFKNYWGQYLAYSRHSKNVQGKTTSWRRGSKLELLENTFLIFIPSPRISLFLCTHFPPYLLSVLLQWKQMNSPPGIPLSFILSASDLFPKHVSDFIISLFRKFPVAPHFLQQFFSMYGMFQTITKLGSIMMETQSPLSA